MIKILSGHDYLKETVKLFKEYKAELNVDVSFQPADETESEIAERYKEPLGKIYIAMIDDNAAVCIAFHPMDDSHNCELKRLYVRPSYRGFHVGKMLMSHAIDSAKKTGYRAIYLDTLSTLKAACHMYENFGFERVDAYYFNPLPNVVYYRLTFN